MPVYRLPDHLHFFPSPLLADTSGILAVGGDLHPDRLILAYSYGIFPWYGNEDPILWWYPEPRCVLYPDQLIISKSLRSSLRNRGYRVTFNTRFNDVIAACKTIPRDGQEDTWIMPEMQDAYRELNRMGVAYSVEVWFEDDLVGGLYGLALGKVFYGESMFSIARDASKVALVHLVDALIKQDCWMIDCQQDTPHLRSLGAELISGDAFQEVMLRNRLVCLQGGVRQLL